MVSMFPPGDEEGDPAKTGPMLVVLSYGGKERISLEKAAQHESAVIFSLQPPIWSLYTSVSIQMDFSAGPPPDAKVPFHWDPDLRVFLVHLDVISFQAVNSRKPSTKVPTCSRKSLLIPLRVVLSRLESATTRNASGRAAEIPWEEWSQEVFQLSEKARIMGVSRTCALIQYDLPNAMQEATAVEAEHTAIFDLHAYPTRRDLKLNPPAASSASAIETYVSSLWKTPRRPEHRRFDWPSQEDIGVLIDDAFISKIIDSLR